MLKATRRTPALLLASPLPARLSPGISVSRGRLPSGGSELLPKPFPDFSQILLLLFQFLVEPFEP